jgi:hypothetical protein
MIQAIMLVFGGIVLIIKVIKSILIKYAAHAVIIGVQFTITATLITFVMLFYVFIITSLVTIYNKIIEIFNYIQSGTNADLSCFFGALDCVGLTAAFQNGFTIVYSALTTILIFHLFKFTLSTMRIIGNELFKLGVLIGQAVK